MRRTRLTAWIAGLALVFVSVGMRCAPVEASIRTPMTPIMPTEHCDQEQDHGTPMPCCAPDAADMPTDTISVGPADAGLAAPGWTPASRPPQEGLRSLEVFQWPPGTGVRITRLCTFLI